jgi:integral membrane sensor domain MASE1
VTLRDLLALSVGSSLSFLLGLVATENDPSTFLKWGLGISLGVVLVAVFALVLGRAWISAHVTRLGAAGQSTVLRIGFMNHGRSD